MIDLHTHTLLSDGALIPAEQIRRAEVRGYRVLGMADHVDLATMGTIIPQLVAAAKREAGARQMRVLAGAELTHVRPGHIAEGVRQARALGARFVIVHGESIAEPVEPGTNRAAIEAGADILAHPGLITEADAALAAKRNVMLEVSAKAGHALCNGHVVRMAQATGAQLLFGSDAHAPEQMPTQAYAEAILAGAGLSAGEIAAIFTHAAQFAEHLAEQAFADETPDW